MSTSYSQAFKATQPITLVNSPSAPRIAASVSQNKLSASETAPTVSTPAASTSSTVSTPVKVKSSTPNITEPQATAPTPTIKRWDNTSVEGGSRPDFSKLISNAILDGESAEYVQSLLDSRGAMIDSDPSLEQYRNDAVAQAANEYIASKKNDSDSIINEMKSMYYGPNSSYAKALEASNKATDASVEQAVRNLEAQKDATNKSYADLFRQTYIDKMNSKKNIDEKLAKAGITGGLAESTLQGLETSYSEALRQGETSRLDTLKELDRAITDTRLTGDITKAQAAQSSAQQSSDSYAAILQSLLSRNDTLEATREANERNDALLNRESALSLALTMLQNGEMPTVGMLDTAGISQTDAITIMESAKKAENDTANDKALELAILKAQYGDLSGLEALGIDTTEYKKNLQETQSSSSYAQALELATLKAQYGDLSGLEALGVDTSGATGSMTLAMAKDAAERGIFDDAVIATLKNNGYTDNMLKEIYGYPDWKTTLKNFFNNIKTNATSPQVIAIGKLSPYVVEENGVKGLSAEGRRILAEELGDLTDSELEFVLNQLGI